MISLQKAPNGLYVSKGVLFIAAGIVVSTLLVVGLVCGLVARPQSCAKTTTPPITTSKND